MENTEAVGDPEIVAVRGYPVGDHPLADLPVGERLDHAVLESHLSNPAV